MQKITCNNWITLILIWCWTRALSASHSCIAENSETVIIIGRSRRKENITLCIIMFSCEICHAFTASFPAIQIRLCISLSMSYCYSCMNMKKCRMINKKHNRIGNVSKMKDFFFVQCLKASLILDKFSSERLSFSVCL